MSAIPFDNTYARDLPGFYAACQPSPAPAPRELFFNFPLAKNLGLPSEQWSESQRGLWFSGTEVPTGAQPLAQAYAGHQFGGFSPQLGDGRALLLGEVVDPQGKRFDIALKGSGRTPFSRGGDGKAAVGPMLREVLISEGLFAMGVPTTRCLAVVATGESVEREESLPGAVLGRVAASHLRVGTFAFFAARGMIDKVRLLADYAILRHDPELASDPDRCLLFFEAVANRQAKLIAQWMNLGFIHGVMNTDNMSISGESIDFGPCAFLEAYDPATVFSSIDHGGRYAYGNQPSIARWNLARLAETLLPLLHPDQNRAIQLATSILEQFLPRYEQARLSGQRLRLGTPDADTALLSDWLDLLYQQKVDYTSAFRSLLPAALGNPAPLLSHFSDPLPAQQWLFRWQRLRPDADTIRSHCPRVIPRNHQVEAALQAASRDGNLKPFHTLLAAIQRPFQEGEDAFGEPAPLAVTACYKTFCGT